MLSARPRRYGRQTVPVSIRLPVDLVLRLRALAWEGARSLSEEVELRIGDLDFAYVIGPCGSTHFDGAVCGDCAK